MVPDGASVFYDPFGVYAFSRNELAAMVVAVVATLALAAMFRFEGERGRVYWIYGYKRGTFWPFVPTGEQQRDNAQELELKANLEGELPVEQDVSMWFGMFDAPL